MDPSKKFSFGFSKIKTTNQLLKPVTVEKEEIQYVDAFDGEEGKFSYKGNTRDDVKKELVIPLVGTKNAYEVIKAKLLLKNGGDENNDSGTVKTEPDVDLSEIPSDTNVAKENADVKPTLEELAVKEIIDDVKKGGVETNTSKSGLVIGVDDQKPNFEGEKESTLEDYENIPVVDYGLAMLRGMGWKEEVGIGKESQIVAPITSKVRPKRMGLGAEGSSMPNVDLPVNRGSYVKVLGGPYKGQFGIVEAVDGDCGRAFVKLDREGTVSLSENVLAVISKKEFDNKGANGDVKENEKKPPIPKEKLYGINLKTIPARKEEDRSKKEHRPKRSESPLPAKHERKHSSRSPSRSHARVKERSSSTSPSPARDKRERKHSSRSLSRSPARVKKGSSSRSPSQAVERNRKHGISSSRSPSPPRKARKKIRDRSSSESPVRKMKHKNRSTERYSKKKYSDSESESPVRRRTSKGRKICRKSSSSESDSRYSKMKERERHDDKKHRGKKNRHQSRSRDKSKKKKKQSRKSSSASDDSDYKKKKKSSKKRCRHD